MTASGLMRSTTNLQASGTNCACTRGANQNSFPMTAGVVDVHLVLIGDGILLATVHFLQECATLQPNVALPHSSCLFVMKMSTIGKV